jgi:hypothetical protein
MAAPDLRPDQPLGVFDPASLKALGARLLRMSLGEVVRVELATPRLAAR